MAWIFGPYFKIDPKEKMILILLTNMKGWDYSRKEIFEKHLQCNFKSLIIYKVNSQFFDVPYGLNLF